MKNALTAKRLSDTLNACGLTAKELADKSGVSKNSISQYMNGVHAPSNISAGKMAKVLGVSPVAIFECRKISKNPVFTAFSTDKY